MARAFQAFVRSCWHCGRESITDFCGRCEQELRASAAPKRDTHPKLMSLVEPSVRSPLGTSTWDSTWDGEIQRGETLAAWDDDPRLIRFVDDIAGGIAPGKPPTYRYAAFLSGEERYLRPSEYGVLKRRLLLDAGVINHPLVPMAVLPVSAGLHTHRLWAAIELLVQARLLGGTSIHEPLPLTRRFLRWWVPMGEGSVRAAMEELKTLEFVVPTSDFDSAIMKSGHRPLKLWRIKLQGGVT